MLNFIPFYPFYPTDTQSMRNDPVHIRRVRCIRHMWRFDANVSYAICKICGTARIVRYWNRETGKLVLYRKPVRVVHITVKIDGRKHTNLYAVLRRD